MGGREDYYCLRLIGPRILSLIVVYVGLCNIPILHQYFISVDRFRWPVERFQHAKYGFSVTTISFQSTLRLCRTPAYFTTAGFWERSCRGSHSQLLDVVDWRKFQFLSSFFHPHGSCSLWQVVIFVT